MAQRIDAIGKTLLRRIAYRLLLRVARKFDERLVSF